MRVADGVDGTAETDYTAEREDPTVRDLPDPLASAAAGGRRAARYVVRWTARALPTAVGRARASGARAAPR